MLRSAVVRTANPGPFSRIGWRGPCRLSLGWARGPGKVRLVAARTKTLAMFSVPGALLVAAAVCTVAAAAGSGAVYAWTALSLVIVAFWAGVVLAVAVGMRSRHRLSTALLPTHTAAALEAADREGRLAPARVVSITETGVGKVPSTVCDIEVVVAPAKGRAYPASLTRLVSAIEAPKLQPDEMVCVLEPGPDATGPSAHIQIVLNPPSSWKPSSSRKRVAREG